MKFVIALVAVLALSSFVAEARTEQETRSLFVQWARVHNKSYETTAHMEQRLAVWTSNLEFVEAHNKLAASSHVSFTLGMNHLADLTNDEYRMMLRTHASRKPAPSTFVAEANVSLPDSVDWRQKGVVTPVKNQGQCGSCWSFSATGSMEGAHALATGNLVAFSEQELVDCVDGGADDCNHGGEMDQGFQYAIQNGMETESDYPYCACSGNQCAFDSSKVVAHFSSYQDITSGDENALQQATAARPTVSVAIDASSMYFQLYSGGVYDDPSCKNGPDDLDHGVLVAGYGSQDSKDYWLVKNSWGASWGLQGYILMSRNKDNQCGIATDASYVLV